MTNWSKIAATGAKSVKGMRKSKGAKHFPAEALRNRMIAYLKREGVTVIPDTRDLFLMKMCCEKLDIPFTTSTGVMAELRRRLIRADVVHLPKVKRKGKKSKKDFYLSDDWRALRFDVLKSSDKKCVLCGRGRAQGAALHVDHIKPRSRFPELALTRSNLQILCEDCNMGKSNRDATDFRVAD